MRNLGKKVFQISLMICIFVSCFFMTNVNASETVTLTPVADTYIDSRYSQYNFGTDTDLKLLFDWENQAISPNIPEAGLYFPGESSNYNYDPDCEKTFVYLKFDLSDLTSDSHNIEKAKLALGERFCNYYTQINVFSLPDTDWDENELTWANAPWAEGEDYDKNHEILDTTGAGKMFVDFNFYVTEAVKANQGGYLTLVLEIDSTYILKSGDKEPNDRLTGFNSKETDYPPELLIDYEGPSISTADGTSQADSNSLEFSPLLLAGLAVVVVLVVVVVAVVVLKKGKKS